MSKPHNLHIRYIQTSQPPHPIYTNLTTSPPDIYQARNQPIRHLVLDECQAIKKEQSMTHKAVKALHYSILAALSRRFIANKWYDLYGVLAMMPAGNPFAKRSDFHRVFANPFNRFADPPPTRVSHLVKCMMGFAVARPSSILHLPGLSKQTYGFDLETADMLMVLFYTKIFAESLREAKRDYSNVHGVLTNSSSTSSMIHATRAQQWAAHPALLPVSKKEDASPKLIQRRMRAYLRGFEKTLASDETVPVGAERARRLREYMKASPPCRHR